MSRLQRETFRQQRENRVLSITTIGVLYQMCALNSRERPSVIRTAVLLYPDPH